jgi:hypothetical protein
MYILEGIKEKSHNLFILFRNLYKDFLTLLYLLSQEVNLVLQKKNICSELITLKRCNRNVLLTKSQNKILVSSRINNIAKISHSISLRKNPSDCLIYKKKYRQKVSFHFLLLREQKSKGQISTIIQRISLKQP